MKRKIVLKSTLLLLFILPLFLTCEKPTRYCVECDCLTRDKCYSTYDRAESFANLMEIGGTCDCSIYED